MGEHKTLNIHNMGRPSKYTKALGEEICELISSTSMGLVNICKLDKMPHVSTVHRWLNDNKEFCDTYTRARETQADLLADQIINIADDHSDDTIINAATGATQINAEWIARCRLQVDARKWKASKLAPKKYGDKVDQKITHEGGISINFTD